MSYQMHFLFVSNRHPWKSHIAAALLNFEDGKHFVGYPTAPLADLSLDPAVVAAMREIGIDLSPNHSSLPASCHANPPAVDRIISLDASNTCEVPAHESWALPESNDQRLEAIRAVRDQIHRKVRELIRSA